MLILATQRREDQLAGYREQLTLELAILSEQMAAELMTPANEMAPLVIDHVRDQESRAV